MKSFILAALTVSFITMPLLAADSEAEPFETKMSDGRISGTAVLANEMWRAFGQPDVQARTTAVETNIKQWSAGIEALLMVLDRDQQTRGKLAQETLFRIVHKFAPATAQRAETGSYQTEVIHTLARLLGNKKYTPKTHKTICTLLSFAGDETAVEALADTFDDTEIRDMARWALIRIPGDKAVDALAAGAHTDEIVWRISLINALAQKAAPRAVPALTEASVSPDGAVRDAALDALARTPHKDALKAIQASLEKDGKNAGTLLLRSSDTLAKAGLLAESEEALTISMMAGLPLTEAQQCEQMFGLGRVGSQDAGTLLLDEVNHKNPRVRGAAIQACVMLKGESASTEIAKKMAAAETPIKVALLDVLGQRGDTMSKEAAELIVTAAGDSDEAIRVAAISAIEKGGIASGVDALVKALGESPGATRDATEHAIAHMPGEAATKKIAEAADGESPVRAGLIVALGRRGDAAAMPVISKATKDKDVAVRGAAYTAIGSLQTPESADLLIERLRGEPGDDYEAAAKALSKLQGEEATAKMLAAYPKFSDTKKAGLLRVVGQRKHAQVVELMAKELKSENQEIRVAALAGMGNQDDPKAAPVLLEAAKQGPAAVTEAAMTGYLRAARATEDKIKDVGTAGEMYVEAIKLAVSDEQKQLALEGLDRTQAASDVALLPIIKPMMSSGNARSHAARIAAGLALRLPEDRKQEIVEVLTLALKQVPGDEVGAKALARLRELGVDVDPARDSGFIIEWWVIGPFPTPDDTMWEKGLFPEQKIDLQASEKIGDATYAWKKYRTPQFNGAVDLEKAVAPKENVGAYAYSEVVSEKEQDAVLKMGSDDSIMVWVNGDKVHANKASRGLRIDEDEAKIHLKAGLNKFLCKVMNGGASWGFSVRVVTPGGEPVVLKINP